MRIDVQIADRVGIAQEILAKLADRALNVSAVEVEPPHVYVEAPALDASGFEQLSTELRRVAGPQLHLHVGVDHARGERDDARWMRRMRLVERDRAREVVEACLHGAV
ncbi:MAG TPA: hypothetical protein PKC95_11395, partial [Thauera aminoaromatica]|nr:hypothetical protein [Thauera aminoaromatica]